MAYSGVMGRRGDALKARTEEDYFRQFLDDLIPTWPVVKIYRIEANGKQVRLDSFPVEMVKPGVLRFPDANHVLDHISVQFWAWKISATHCVLQWEVWTKPSSAHR